MNYVGVDLHKETSWFYVVDSKGQKVMSKNISNKLSELNHFLSRIPKPFSLAVESTYNWYFFVDLAQKHSDSVFLANSYALKAFAKRNKKTDKIDAKLIATVLQKGFLPTVHIPCKETRELRELLRLRIKLVTDRSRNIFRLKALLDKLGLISYGNFTTLKQLEKTLEISGNLEQDSYYKKVITEYVEQIKFLILRISLTEKQFKQIAEEDINVKNLTSIYGISYFSAALLKSEIDDISRFKSFNRLCSYAGLAPRVSQSGNKIHHGALSKNRSKNIQWILLENTYHFVKGYSDKQAKFDEIKKRKNHNVAKVALARDLLKAVWTVLKEKREYTFNFQKNKKVA